MDNLKQIFRKSRNSRVGRGQANHAIRLRPTVPPKPKKWKGREGLTYPAYWLKMSGVAGIAVVALTWASTLEVPEERLQLSWTLTADDLARVVTPGLDEGRLPGQINIGDQNHSFEAEITYTFDHKLQQEAERLFDRYQPDYGAFAAIDPDSGEVLALVSHQKSGPPLGNLALQARFPAASVFKIVTAAAAIDLGKASPGTVIPFNGKSTTLYKSQVLRHKNNKWTRRSTLTKAFSQSSNPYFARLGIERVGGERLNYYAAQLGFNRGLKSDFLFELGTTEFEAEDKWSTAEVASGFTENTLISPLHGALLAATAINSGRLPHPHLVTAVERADGVLVYSDSGEPGEQVIKPKTASSLRVLMSETVKSGTARKEFSRFFKSHRKSVEVGGKTGRLSGHSPEGTNNWFVGYAMLKDRRIAFAILTVDVEKWQVRPATLANQILRSYFSSQSVAG